MHCLQYNKLWWGHVLVFSTLSSFEYKGFPEVARRVTRKYITLGYRRRSGFTLSGEWFVTLRLLLSGEFSPSVRKRELLSWCIILRLSICHGTLDRTNAVKRPSIKHNNTRNETKYTATQRKTHSPLLGKARWRYAKHNRFELVRQISIFTKLTDFKAELPENWNSRREVYVFQYLISRLIVVCGRNLLERVATVKSNVSPLLT